VKRKSRILVSLALGLTLIGTTVYAANEPNEPKGLTVLPDKAAIKEMKHYKKINELQEKNQKAELHKYIYGLSEKELFETAEEMIKSGADFEREGMILIPAIKEKWKNGPSENAHKMLKDKGYSPKFRQHVLDAMFSNGIVERTLENPTNVNEVATLVTDKSEDEMVRTYALKKLKANGKLDHQKLKLEKIVFDSSEPTKVRGAAIVAMNRTKDPAFEKTTDRIIKGKEIQDEALLEYAIVESAKGKTSKKYMKEIKELAKSNASSELKGTITYAMAISGDKESIKLAVSSYDESEKEISFYTFRNRMNTVIDLLNSKDKEDIKDGIKASMYGQVANALPVIEKLKNKSTDAEIQELASQALENIDPSYVVDESVLAKEGK
jgi:hypothetical protein